VIITCGGIQSNHARATAILARELGMEPVLCLRGTPPAKAEGNYLLDQLVGARIIFVTPEQYSEIHTLFKSLVEGYRAEGIKAFAIPEGGSDDLGVAGYVAAMEEIAAQCGVGVVPQRFSSVVCATGSGGTYAGLLAGRNLLGWDDGLTECVTFNVCHNAREFTGRVIHLLTAAVQRFRWPISFMTEDIHIIDGYVGPGYAQATPELMSFITEVARTDGILLDPVYTGKALFGLVSELNASPERARIFGRDILFVHTGGLPSLFAFGSQWEAALGPHQPTL
jgi:D-cysteine desulfhydrase